MSLAIELVRNRRLIASFLLLGGPCMVWIAASGGSDNNAELAAFGVLVIAVGVFVGIQRASVTLLSDRIELRSYNLAGTVLVGRSDVQSVEHRNVVPGIDGESKWFRGVSYPPPPVYRLGVSDARRDTLVTLRRPVEIGDVRFYRRGRTVRRQDDRAWVQAGCPVAGFEFHLIRAEDRAALSRWWDGAA